MLAAAYDESGKRVATADERQELRVHERAGDGWHCCVSWKVRSLRLAGARGASARLRARLACAAPSCLTRAAQAHDAKLRGVAWASPAFGEILCSCADDGAKVWLILPAGEAKLLATLGGSRAAVCVAFAPQHLGLVLAVAGADGAVRLYESADRTGSTWDEQVRSTPTAAGLAEPCVQAGFEAGSACTGLAWCLHGAARPPALAVGVAGAPARVWVFDAEQRRWIPACDLPGAPMAGLAWAQNDGA